MATESDENSEWKRVQPPTGHPFEIVGTIEACETLLRYAQFYRAMGVDLLAHRDHLAAEVTKLAKEIEQLKAERDEIAKGEERNLLSFVDLRGKLDEAVDKERCRGESALDTVKRALTENASIRGLLAMLKTELTHSTDPRSPMLIAGIDIYLARSPARPAPAYPYFPMGSPMGDDEIEAIAGGARPNVARMLSEILRQRALLAVKSATEEADGIHLAVMLDEMAQHEGLFLDEESRAAVDRMLAPIAHLRWRQEPAEAPPPARLQWSVTRREAADHKTGIRCVAEDGPHDTARWSISDYHGTPIASGLVSTKDDAEKAALAALEARNDAGLVEAPRATETRALAGEPATAPVSEEP